MRVRWSVVFSTSLLPIPLVATVSCAAVARWPALDYKSDRAFYPLMVSFSRYPFHDVYETVASIPAPKPPVQPPAMAGRGAALFAKARAKYFPGATNHQRDWRQHHQTRPAKMPTKSICHGLIYLPQELEASGRRILPPKMRKLLKYCGFI
ncbi:uncharacterized protein LOC131284277 [Anopheles ziemanni]|uniref:uncharacterized protein LOC131272306 n=1 Tax=Anopheles coustani TaxID=139045 RepID=UPI0026594F1B|nr:uncharacterized protein LOC131272306 [Anopheles coustani]XP_058169114.1 uncharacterized protein LOC131284277 [Anopheles ziemanni]